ncbi:MAG TPA: SLC13 family permease [Polyangiaceae bacterium]|jgi:Na+/H+ antiporter NhaD/arsenite permease-like protein|nr:SLC13 family permease [Polyangiaceae bacterium]
MTAALIFALTYVALAFGRVPGLRSDRVAAVIVGAALMVSFRVLSFARAEQAVDGATIALLFGMMAISAALEVSGVFALAGWQVTRRAHGPLALLVAVSVAAAVLSAIMINDVVCLAFTPLVLTVTETLECDPKPYLIALATSSNVGSVATITGNPQNILIGSLSRIPYGAFAAELVPVAIVALALNVAVIWFVYGKELRKPFPKLEATLPPAVSRSAVWKGAVVSVVVVVAFALGAPPPLAAILGGSAMLLSRATDPKLLYARIDWTLLALFVGLFVVVAGLDESGVSMKLRNALAVLRVDTVFGMTVLAGILSNVVSNVPAVMVLKSSVLALPHPHTAWLTLAMASTLSGNLTLPGSLATIIVVERARERTHISFLDFVKVGAPSALLGATFGALWLGR